MVFTESVGSPAVLGFGMVLRQVMPGELLAAGVSALPAFWIVNLTSGGGSVPVAMGGGGVGGITHDQIISLIKATASSQSTISSFLGFQGSVAARESKP